MTYKRLKLKLRVFLAGHIVAMVTYCATKLTATYSPMIGQFVDTMILASTDKDVVIMIHQTVSLGKYCKLFPSTLSQKLTRTTSTQNLQRETDQPRMLKGTDFRLGKNAKFSAVFKLN